MENIKSYLISLDEVDLSQILKTWTWLIGEDKTVIALSKMGDALLKDNQNRLFHLDTRAGEIELKNYDYSDFYKGKLESEEYELILLPDLVENLEKKGTILGNQQVYAFTKIPLLGGTYNKDNIYMVNLYEHYALSGKIHSQFKGLPDGTKVQIIPEE